MTKGLASQAKRKLGDRASRRYLRFLASEQYEGLEYLHLHSSGLQGWFLPDFTDHRCLYDAQRLGRAAGLPSLTDHAWQRQLRDLAPLALLEPVVAGPGRARAGALLAMTLQPTPCAVYLVTGAELRSQLLANSLDAFVRGPSGRSPPAPTQATANAGPLTFRWSSEPEPAHRDGNPPALAAASIRATRT